MAAKASDYLDQIVRENPYQSSLVTIRDNANNYDVDYYNSLIDKYDPNGVESFSRYELNAKYNAIYKKLEADAKNIPDADTRENELRRIKAQRLYEEPKAFKVDKDLADQYYASFLPGIDQRVELYVGQKQFENNLRLENLQRQYANDVLDAQGDYIQAIYKAYSDYAATDRTGNVTDLPSYKEAVDLYRAYKQKEASMQPKIDAAKKAVEAQTNFLNSGVLHKALLNPKTEDPKAIADILAQSDSIYNQLSGNYKQPPLMPESQVGKLEPSAGMAREYFRNKLSNEKFAEEVFPRLDTLAGEVNKTYANLQNQAKQKQAQVIGIIPSTINSIYEQQQQKADKILSQIEQTKRKTKDDVFVIGRMAVRSGSGDPADVENLRRQEIESLQNKAAQQTSAQNVQEAFREFFKTTPHRELLPSSYDAVRVPLTALEKYNKEFSNAYLNSTLANRNELDRLADAAVVSLENVEQQAAAKRAELAKQYNTAQDPEELNRILGEMRAAESAELAQSAYIFSPDFDISSEGFQQALQVAKDEYAAKVARRDAILALGLSDYDMSGATKEMQDKMAQINAEYKAIQDRLAVPLPVVQPPPLPTTPTTPVPSSGIPKDQADRLATEIIAFGNLKEVRDGSGNPVANPAEYLSTYIQQYGYEPLVKSMQEQGLGFTSGVTPKVAPEIADKIADATFKAVSAATGATPLTYSASSSNLKYAIQNKGIEEALKEFAALSNVSVDTITNSEPFKALASPGYTIYDADGSPVTIKESDIFKDLYRQSEPGLAAYGGSQYKDFESIVNRILSGEVIRQEVPKGVTPEEAVTQAFTTAGVNASPTDYTNWVNTLKSLGIGPGIALLNERLSAMAPNKQIELTAPPPSFDFSSSYTGFPTTPTTPTTPGTTPTAPTTPTTPGTTPSYPAPYTPPTTPTSPYPSPGESQTTFTPALYQPPPPLITRGERPSLDSVVEYIESTRPGAGPMPYMTPQQVGATPVEPASYADLFGYTPYTEYMGQSEYTTPMSANLYAAGYQANVPTTGMKEGGSVAREARGLAAMGRGGDSMLVHMAPEEVAGLRAIAMQQGEDLTINPETGLPEAKKLKQFFRQVVLPAAAAYFGAPYLGGIANASMLVGAGAALKTGNLERGIMTGLTAYGGANLASSAFGAPTAFGTPSPGYGGGPGGSGAGGGPGSASQVPSQYGGVPDASSPDLYVKQDVLSAGDYAPNLLPPSTAPTTATTASGTAAVANTAQAGASTPGKFQQATGISPTTAVVGGTLLAGLGEGEKERDRYEEERRRQEAEEERRRQLGLAAFERSLEPVDTRKLYGAGGGLVALARGGMTYMEAGGTTGPTGEPRMVAGNGDGMSDSVPATIEGVQEARLANDEFVIPADVVADIGNGSSSAGAKKLYDMMSRIREARHGTTEQPPEINAEQFMPA